MLLLLTS